MPADKIETIIWDLDNTLYKFTDSPIDHWNDKTAEYALSSGVKMSLEEATYLASQGWQSNQNSARYFVDDHGLDQHDLHIGVAKLLDEKSVIACIDTCTEVRTLHDKRHIILTYAMRDWACRVLDHLGLTDLFEPDLIIGADNYRFELKSESALGILTALERSGANPEQTVFVEDTLANLKPAKEQANVKTAYLHHDRPYTNQDMPYVDFITKDTPELVKKHFKD